MGNHIAHGQQSLQKLNSQGRQLESVVLPEKDFGVLRRELNRNAVDFSVKKDRASGEYTFYFKGQDIDRVHKGLEKCIQGLEKDASRKSVKEVMEHASKKASEQSVNRDAKGLEPDKERLKPQRGAPEI